MSVALTANLQFGEVVVDLHSAIFGVEDIGYNVRDGFSLGNSGRRPETPEEV